jgi:hypothetical protein
MHIGCTRAGANRRLSLSVARFLALLRAKRRIGMSTVSVAICPAGHADNPHLGARRFDGSRVAAAVARNGLERCIAFLCLLNSKGWLFVPGLTEPLWAGLAGRLSAATARTRRVLAIERITS